MRRSKNNTVASETPTRACDQAGCPHAGEYRAPRSREDLNNYYWFCLDHVRAYNAAWDYYAGLSAAEIERMLRQDVTWQRPTWPLGARIAGRAFRLRDSFGFFEADAEQTTTVRRRVLSAEEDAMRVLDLAAPVTVVQLKTRYKELVKVHHPDANGGDKAAEERFKMISQAYQTLMNSLNV